MPVVTNTIKRPDGTAYTSGRVVIELAGENGRPLSGGYVSASDYTIESAYTIESLTAGVWSQSLVANSLISPAGTVWRVTEQVDGRNHVYYLTVPDGAGPYFVEDILTDAPSSVASSALRNHLEDTTAPHTADAVGAVAAVDAGSAGGKNIISPSTIDGGADVAVVFGGTTSFPHTIGAVGLPTISGGYDNKITTGIASTISGGAHHVHAATDGHTFTGGGSTQIVNGAYGAAVAGLSNTSEGNYAFLGGGRSNLSGDSTNRTGKTDQVVVGGQSNEAKGHQATSVGGFNNTVSGAQAFVGGGLNNLVGASATAAAVAGGSGNNITQTYGVIGGGDSNQVTASLGAVLGGKNGSATRYGEQAHAAGAFAAQGDAQTSVVVARRSTSDATPAALFLDGSAQRITIPSDTTVAFRILVAARRTDADNESAAYEYVGCIDNNAGTTALVGTVTETVIAEDTAAWAVAVTADDTNDALIITVTGEAAKTIRWVARVELVQVGG